MKALQKLVADCGKLQKDVAADLNISPSAFNQYVSGKRSPAPEILVTIAQYFGVSVDYLIGVSDDAEQKKPTEAGTLDEPAENPLDAELRSAFYSLSPEDQDFFLEMMRHRSST